MRKLIVILSVSWFSILNSQNLIINPGFEETGETGTSVHEDPFVTGGITGWFNPNNSSPDYSSHSHSGSHGGGFYAIDLPYYQGERYREYVGGSLKKPLVAGVEYRFSMAVTVKGWLNCAISELGVYFSGTKPYKDSYFELDVKPQVVIPNTNTSAIASGWVIVKGKFIAKGGENYFVVGNFLDNDHTKLIGIGEQHSVVDAAYYYIDDLCLKGGKEPETADENKNGDITPDDPREDIVTDDYSGDDANNDVVTNDDDTRRDGEKSNRSQPQVQDNSSSGKTTSRQDPEIHDVITNDDPQLQPELDSIHITAGETFVAENIYFNTDKSSLKPESYAPLDQIVAAMKASPKLSVQVVGYTDDSGNLKYNLELSKDRAKTVAKYLIKHGISKKRVTYIGKGAYIKRGQKPKPGQSGSNRRVEFVFTEATR